MYLDRYRRAILWSIRNYRWSLVYILVLAPLAYWVGLPVFQSLDRAFAHRPAAAEMFPGMRAMYFFQWLNLSHQQGTWPLTFNYLLGLGFSLWLAHLIWSGGILGLVYQGGYRTYKFRATVRAGWLLLPRQLLAWPLWFLFAATVLLGSGAGLIQWLRHLIRTQQDAWFLPAVAASLVLWAILLVLVSFLWDLTRIEAIRSGYWSLTAAFRSLMMLFRRLPHYLAMALFYAVLGSILMIAGGLLQKALMSTSTAMAVHLGWLVYALAVWGRILARIGLWLHLSEEFHRQDIEMARPEGLEPPTW